MELKEGMYVRYVPTLGEYTQKISKIIKTKNCLLDMGYMLDNEEELVFSSHFDEIVKASYNIIGLIEVGDYVNGEKVDYIIEPDVCGDEKLDDGKVHTVDCGRNQFIELWQIKSIVTKEQFEQIQYRIGE